MPSIYVTSTDERKVMFKEYWEKITEIKSIREHENKLTRRYKKPVLRIMFSRWV